jgi:signal transduction histidine kinase
VNDLARKRDLERTLTRIRLAALVVAVVDIAFLNTYPSRSWELAAYAVTATAVAGSIVLGLVARRDLDEPTLSRFGVVAFCFDAAVAAGYVLVFQYEAGTPIRELLILVVAEGAVRWGRRGALAATLLGVGILAVAELFRARHGWGTDAFVPDHVVFGGLILLLTAMILGWLVSSLRAETALSGQRAAEAEALRDQLGRRADLLDATNRCARALASSLELEVAFAAFARELHGLLDFERVTLALVQEGSSELRVLAVAGAQSETVLPSGATFPAYEPVRRALAGETVVRQDMADGRHAEERVLLESGLRARILAPLTLGPVPIGVLAIAAREPDAFSAEEVELVTLLARVAASAVQNLRAYAAEKATADELRRLSSLRADFVSLVSHELRNPMAAVIGSARTLRERWRELSVDQRSAFLDLIADETQRLADLVGDVLDTSRIEAGTFSYTFETVDLGELVQDTVATARVAQDEVRLELAVAPGLPHVSGDRTRLRQVAGNLLDNAVKYSPEGGSVLVSVTADGEDVVLEVADRGPGVAPEHQGLIFEKFGRTKIGGAKPGTGLGLFIARSIAEAHGGSLTVRSDPGSGARFELRLPAAARIASATS